MNKQAITRKLATKLAMQTRYEPKLGDFYQLVDCIYFDFSMQLGKSITFTFLRL